jgi:hypothetical protein
MRKNPVASSKMQGGSLGRVFEEVGRSVATEGEPANTLSVSEKILWVRLRCFEIL